MFYRQKRVFLQYLTLNVVFVIDHLFISFDLFIFFRLPIMLFLKDLAIDIIVHLYKKKLYV